MSHSARCITSRWDAKSWYVGNAGQGIARQRQAIVNGLRDSVTAFGDDVPNVSSHDVVRLLFCSLLWCMCALAWIPLWRDVCGLC